MPAAARSGWTRGARLVAVFWIGVSGITITAPTITAQNRITIRAQPPGRDAGVGAVLDPAQASPEGVDEGPTVMMPISLNIDRHLKKAREFLEREKFSSAFEVLQAVIEGRTMVDVVDDGVGEVDAGEGNASGAQTAESVENGGGAVGAEAFGEVSATGAVFSDDGRIYQPVRKLCHELLANLPAEGVAAYRAQFEYAAERAFELASATQSVVEIEAVFERYFLTTAAARALELGGDLRMDRGQFRAALVNYRLLLDTYPDEQRSAAGIDDTMVAIKTALCFTHLGDREQADAVLADLARSAADSGSGTDATVRILGELVPLGELAAHPIFRPVRPPTTSDALAADDPRNPHFDVGAELVPLWEFRFEHDRPYKLVRDPNERNVGWITGDAVVAVRLTPSLAAPGTTIRAIGDRLVFLDHYRLRSHDSLSGRMLAETDGELQERIAADQMRARVAATDFLTSAVTTDGTRLFAVIGVPKSQEDLGQILDNQIVAYRPADLAALWSTEDHPATAKRTYLARPTVFGSRLLVPSLVDGTIVLACLDATTGELLYDTAIHRGGTDLLRPLASPVVVDQGVAYVLTNSGGLAAVDVHTATLRWIRRYERVHPLRPDKLAPSERARNPFGVQANVEVSRFPGFAPSELVLFEGTLVFAPADGNVLMSLDAATGEPIWMLNRRSFVPEIASDSRWTYLIGTHGSLLLVGGEHDVTCVDMRTGVRLWRDELPSITTIGSWRGRGTVTKHGDLLMPGLREVLVRSLTQPNVGGAASWRRVPLPALSIGRDPLEGEFNIRVDDMYLTASYEGGVEVYSSVGTLLANAERADDPERVALLQAQAGELSAAFSTLEAVDRTSLSADERRMVASRALEFAAELAAAMAAHGARADALAVLDRARALLEDPLAIQRWHLTRIDVFDALGDAAEVESEQRTLYELLERS